MKKHAHTSRRGGRHGRRPAGNVPGGQAFRPRLELLESRLAPALVPLTVTFTGIQQLDNPDGGDDGDYYVIVRIKDGVMGSPVQFDNEAHPIEDDVFNPFAVDPAHWRFTQSVEQTAGPVNVFIALMDEDNFLRFGDQEMDINPRSGFLGISLNVDPRTGIWTGDVPVQQPFSQGAGDDERARLTFDITIPGVTDDSDGDGLPDSWETNGIDTDGNWGNGPELNLPQWGARPNHKDLFLEMDWMPGQAPLREEIQALKAAFAVAPGDAGTTAAALPNGVNARPNPDGQPGINLWVDTGELTDGAGNFVGDRLGGGNQVPFANVSNLNANFYALKNANFNPLRRLVFRYAISGATPVNTAGTSTGSNGPNTLNDATQNWLPTEWVANPRLVLTITGGTGAGQTRNIVSNSATRLVLDANWAATPDNTSTYTIGWSSGGWGEIGGNDFIEYNHDAGTIMHELGHTLNLRHGGFEGRNYKPNYVGAMNYDHQFGIPQNSGATVLDYAPARVSLGGTTTGGNTATTFNDTTQAWMPNQWAGAFVELDRAFGFASGGNTVTTLNDTTQNWGTNQLVGASVTVFFAGGNERLSIVSNTATRLTLGGSWTTVPGAGTGYAINLRQVRRVVSNTATQLVLDPARPWASVPAGSTPYALFTATQPRGAAVLPQLVETGLPETLVLDPSDTANRMIFSNTAGTKVPYPLNGQDRSTPADGVIDGPDYDGNGAVNAANVPANADAPNDTIINPAAMVGHDDWRRISLPFRQFGEAADGAINPETDAPPTLAELLAFQTFLNTADLRLAVTTSASTVFQGDHLVYTYTATVNGTNPADGVTVTDTLPAGVIFVSASSSQGSSRLDGNTVTWRLGAVWPGVPVTLRLEVIPLLVGSMTNAAAAATIDIDSAAGNNAAAATTTVLNVPPEITSVSLDRASINENDSVVLTFTFTDPGLLDVHAADITWGDGAIETVSIALGARTLSVAHRYLDDHPATGTPADLLPIRVTVRDNNGGSDTDGTAVTVHNVAPVFTAVATSSASSGPAREGEPVTISGTFTDVGTLDTHSVTMNWGDGTVSVASVVQGAGAGDFAGQHAYQFGGIYPVVVTLRDDDTGEVSRTKTVFVTGVGIHEVGGLTSLQVIGTIGPDQVMINEQGNGVIKVHADFLSDGQRTLPLAGIDIIQVVTLAGDDHVSVGGSVDLPAVIDGGDGDDHLNNDGVGGVVIGGRGNDELIGGNSRDILIGGVGADRLVGNGADDILIGGLTAYDSGADDDKLANDLRLLKLLEEWKSPRMFAERVANLRAGAGPVLAGTGLKFANGVTVFDDLEADALTASAGTDWLFLGATDTSSGGEETN